jgi:hypothetical protein
MAALFFSVSRRRIWLLEIFPLKSLGGGVGGDGDGIDCTAMSKRNHNSST